MSRQQVIPSEALTGRFAYTAIVGKQGYTISRADENIQGHTPIENEGTFDSYQKAKDRAEKMNAALGLDAKTALDIVLSTMRGQLRAR